jgi:tRNA dimethylallyltransferase
VRALEVVEITGAPFSANVTWDRYDSRYELAVAGLERERADLHGRIDRRVDAMLAGGLVEEAREVERRGPGRTAAQALGYRQVFEGGGAEEIARATRRFARRQLSWFKADPRVRWFEAAAPALEERLVAFFRDALALPSSP